MESALLEHWKTELLAIKEQADVEHRDLTLSERSRVGEILDKVRKVRQDIEISKMVDGDGAPDPKMDPAGGGPRGSGLASLLLDGAGWHFKSNPTVTVPLADAVIRAK